MPFLFSAHSVATTWLIYPDGSGVTPTVQAGIDSAATGDTVSLADGVYTGPGNVNIRFHGKAITVRSESNDPSSCIISCDNPTWDQKGFFFDSGEGPNSILLGVTIRYGRGRIWDGGGIRCISSSPVIQNCVFTENGSDEGGGMYIDDNSSPTIVGCVFLNNTTRTHGAGISCRYSRVAISNCRFIGNTAEDNGGGIYSSSCSLTVTAIEFASNTAEWFGGGMTTWYSSTQMNECEFKTNSAWDGGGFYLIYSTASLDSCIFQNNIAGSVAGGMMMRQGAGYPQHDCVLTNCIFSENLANQGGGIACWEGYSAPTIDNCTFWSNGASQGGGIFKKQSVPVIANSIIASCTQGEALYCMGGVADLACCDLFDNAGGDWIGCIADLADSNGNFSADPIFCDAENGDFSVDSFSPCLPGNHPGGFDCGLVGAIGCGCDVVTSVTDRDAAPKAALRLTAWPNPTSGSVSLRYSHPKAQQSSLHVYDIRGRIIRSMGVASPAGIQTWNGMDDKGQDVAPGVYFVRLSDGEKSETTRLTLIR